MSITPLSVSEIENLQKILSENGWKIKGLIENYFRYSLKKDKALLLTIKLPVLLPVRLNIPFEVISFKISLVVKFWNLDEKTTKTILYLMKVLRNLALNVSTEQNFPVKGKETQLLDLLNLILPETIKGENEKAWVNRIRISLMNKREKFLEFDNSEIKKIVDTLEELGLNATFKLPWELKKGIPKLRTSETLLFSNEEPFDEFFILEKGFFTYFKDLEYEKFYVRTHFETYTPYILHELFKEDSEVKMDLLLKDWIKFSRSLLNSILDLINSIEINQNMFLDFRAERELLNNSFLGDINNFPFSALHYESIIAKELYQLHNDLLNHPPTDFEVIEHLNYYTEAEELINNYNFEKANEILTNALKTFNKHKQKKMVVSILLFLKKIALFFKQYEVAINYLNNALSIAKSGEVPLRFIIEIQFALGRVYFSLHNYIEAEKHFTIIINFIQNEDLTFQEKDHFYGIAHIYLGIIYLEEKSIPKAKESFKKAFELSNEYVFVKLKYHLLRAKYYKSKGKLSQAQKMLKLSLKNLDLDSIDEQYHNTLIDLLLELAEYYIHDRKDTKKASYFLGRSKVFLSTKAIPGIRKSIRWNLLASDFYKFLANNSEKSSYYLKEAQRLKSQLNSIGIPE